MKSDLIPHKSPKMSCQSNTTLETRLLIRFIDSVNLIAKSRILHQINNRIIKNLSVFIKKYKYLNFNLI